MKKKVLFVIGSAHAGGTITSLLNLLSLLDDEKIEAHLFLQTHTGVLLSRTQEHNLLPEDPTIAAVLRSKSELRGKGLRAYLTRASFVLRHRLFGVKKAYAHFYKKSAKKLSGKYDAVVAYQEGAIADYARYIKTPKHVAWCHMDYDAVCVAGNNSRDDWKQIYGKFEYIACVSDVVRNSIIENLQYPEDKISVVYNTIPPEYIKSRAVGGDNIERRAITLVSSGRYVQRKRFDRFVLAAETLKAREIDFIWYLLGDGELYAEISDMIKQKDVGNQLIQVGAIENPFVYYNASDVFVMASESEGQPMVLNEALTLGVPVITTEFPSAREVVRDGVYGMIVPNSDEGLADGVLRFAQDSEFREKLNRDVRDFRYGNDEILESIYKILDV